MSYGRTETVFQPVLRVQRLRRANAAAGKSHRIPRLPRAVHARFAGVAVRRFATAAFGTGEGWNGAIIASYLRQSVLLTQSTGIKALRLGFGDNPGPGPGDSPRRADGDGPKSGNGRKAAWADFCRAPCGPGSGQTRAR
ncbi:hypothetical protein CO2235_10099 [Cupriavidus oxalaticus]|uniref:Uncharacterized protein n=1 Tax=Cupriavidus oxalaticus TaxID=96344 RepID=A0A976G8E6_9BURK|nr:hypothetical protein CO2235_10099 [Cupriavidus oxalaticus]